MRDGVLMTTLEKIEGNTVFIRCHWLKGSIWMAAPVCKEMTLCASDLDAEDVSRAVHFIHKRFEDAWREGNASLI